MQAYHDHDDTTYHNEHHYGHPFMPRPTLDDTPAVPPRASLLDRRYRYPWPLAQHRDTFLLALAPSQRTPADIRRVVTACHASWQAWKRARVRAGIWTQAESSAWRLKSWTEAGGVRVRVEDRRQLRFDPLQNLPADQIPPIQPRDRGRVIDDVSPVSQTEPVVITDDDTTAQESAPSTTEDHW